MTAPPSATEMSRRPWLGRKRKPTSSAKPLKVKQKAASGLTGPNGRTVPDRSMPRTHPASAATPRVVIATDKTSASLSATRCDRTENAATSAGSSRAVGMSVAGSVAIMGKRLGRPLPAFLLSRAIRPDEKLEASRVPSMSPHWYRHE